MRPQRKRIMTGCLITGVILVMVPIAIAIAARYGIPMLEVAAACSMVILVLLIVARDCNSQAPCQAAIKTAHTMVDILNKETGESITMDTLKTAFEAAPKAAKVKILIAMYSGLHPEDVEAQHLCDLLKDPYHTVEDVEKVSQWLKEKTA